MSSWARREVAGDGQGRVMGLLNKVPGYSGYRQKESRREEDKRVREELARGYELVARRLADVQGDLLRGRRFAEIGNVERLERTLRLFVDRLKTATYGYGGLFSDRPIDERALDQIAAFDRALGDGADELGKSVDALAAAARGTGDLGEGVRATGALIDGLNRRFDLRGQAVETGKAQEGPGVAGLFTAPRDEQAHVASDLHFGDAVSIAATDYLVQGRMEFHTADTAWRQYLLRDGERECWLHVPPSTAEPMALLDVAAEAPGEGEGITVGGKAYTQAAAGEATAEVVGEAGKQAGRRVHFRRFTGDDGAILFAYDWGGAERQTLAGRTLDPLEIKVYSQP